MGTRRERVVVSLDDDFSSPMRRCAGATATLNHELDRLSGQAVMSSRFARTVERDMDGVSKSTRRASADINQLSGRLSLLARFVAVFGPAASPIGAVAAAGVAGLVTQFGLATVGALSLVVAAQGVGDALKAVEAARLEPTAENLAKAEQAMAKLAPEARDFVARFQELRPVLGDLQKAAARGWFPGLTDALASLEKAAPRIERILEAVSKAGGDAVAEGAASLAGERWRDFFEYIETEAPEAVTDLSTALGSLTHGLAELLMVSDPGNDGLRKWLVDTAGAFDDWATNLDDADVEGFFDYVSETGPKLAAATGAIANGILQIAEAAAPLGGPVLDSIAALADAIAAIADSPLGTPIMTAVTAVSALSLASRGLDAALKGANIQLAAMGAQSPRTAAALGMVHKAALALIGIQLGTQIIDGVRESASDAAPDVEKLAGSLERLDSAALKKELGGSLKELLGASNQGGLRGLSEDLAGAAENASLLGVNIGDVAGIFVPQLKHMGDEAERTKEAAAALDQALVEMVTTVGGQEAKRAFDDMTKAEDLSASAKQDLLKLLPGYTEALKATGAAAGQAATSADTLAASQDLIQAKLLASRDAARESAKSFLDFSDSIAGDKFSLSGWLDAFEAQVRALANFRDNIQTLRDKGLNESIIDELIDQGPAAAQAVEGLANAGEGAIKRLNGAFGDGRGEIRGMGKDAKKAEEDLQNLGNANASPKIDADPTAFDNKRRAVDGDLDRLDKKKTKPSIDLADGPFQRARQHAANQLNDLTKPRTVTVTAKLDAAGAFARLRAMFGAAAASGSANAAEKGINPADGGTIPRGGGRPVRAAVGSTVPDDGGGYRDYLLYMLAPLEEVISNRRGQADQFRPELKDINAGLSRAEVVERMLMRGLSSPRTAAGGGTAGKQIVSTLAGSSGPRKGDNVLGYFPALGKSVKEWASELEKSKSKIEDEISARESLADSLGEVIKGRLTSDLFGATDPWSAGSSFEDVMATLLGDTAAAKGQTADIQELRDKGLSEDALAALLAEADNETIAAWSDLSADQLDQYERAFQDRALAVAAAQTAGMNAAFGAQFAGTNARLDQVKAELAQANRLLAAAPDATGKSAGDQFGKKTNRGAGNGSRNGRRG
ncbi:hypothetical protein KVF89_22345 [Nocardioides carbamazepini]|uniref:hypothetical protein n=1 Tax=Nocardioides carbamazepini TaxID=2854259 RepID=UPI00214A897F|nr:hypothetical protein [Nocardioides carbamazepini]MCR1785297.1 hypothetical protein [Nocardioides carbamazepini]